MNILEHPIYHMQSNLQNIALLHYHQIYSAAAQYLQSGDSNISNQSYIQKNNAANNKVKTSLCKKWTQTGACPYGYKCQFAHGIEQLRCNVDDSSYKTKPCNSFFKKGYCPYGFRCNFSHKAESQQNLQKCQKQSQGIFGGYYQILKEAKHLKGSTIKNIYTNDQVIEDGDQKSISSTEDCNSQSLSKSILLSNQQNFFRSQFENYDQFKTSQIQNQFHSQYQKGNNKQMDENEADESLLFFNIDQF